MNRIKRAILVILLLCSCIACDQTTKGIARDYLAAAPAISYLGDLFRFQYAENQGAFLGLGSHLSAKVRTGVLVVLVGMMLTGMLVFTLTQRRLPLERSIALALIIGGGLSNLLDRLIYHGAVIDFMNIGLANLRTGIFNVADVVIFIGVGLLCLSILRHTDPDNASCP
jgi:signal peptidase II